MGEHDDKHSLLHKIGHKAHNGVNFLVLYELVNKIHEYAPDWLSMVRQLVEGLKHA